MEKKERVWWNRSESGSEEKKRFRLRKDQLLIGLLTGILLIIIALPAQNRSAGSSLEKEKSEDAGTGNNSTFRTESQPTGSRASDAYTREMENRLAEILSRVEGVGAVQVLITWKSTVEKVVEKDIPGSSQSMEEKDSSGGVRSTREETKEMETVYEETESGKRIPYVVKEIQPQAEGVLVIAQGGGNAVVAQQILEAVQALFSLDTHKIKIMKMEGSK